MLAEPAKKLQGLQSKDGRLLKNLRRKGGKLPNSLLMKDRYYQPVTNPS